ncbi:pilin [Aeromonas caviae]|nr:pilin [Aeromonas caviae]
MTQLVAATGALKTAVEVCMQTYGPGQCALGSNGMPADVGSYAGVDLTYTAPASGADAEITATVSTSAASSTLAPLTATNTVTLAASSSVPMVWAITCDSDATDNGYCPQ